MLRNNACSDGQQSLVDQPDSTYSGTKIQEIKLGLPKEIDSVCPECMDIIKATLYMAKKLGI